MSILYIVATPIGNLEDFSFRALRILKEVDLILAEDTRQTKKLLDHYQIKTPTLSYHQHSKLQKIDYIINLLREGKNLALVSDAGTPGISDPGNKLIHQILEFTGVRPRQVLPGSDPGKFYRGQTPVVLTPVVRSDPCSKLIRPGQIKIVPIPGPSALTCAASISGFPMDKFLFLGYPPTKKKRKKFFEEVVNSKYPVIFYESPYRIIKSLRDLHETNAKQDTKQTRKIVVCRELTKKFETIYRGSIEEVIKQIEKDKIKGEFVVIIEDKQ